MEPSVSLDAPHDDVKQKLPHPEVISRSRKTTAMAEPETLSTQVEPIKQLFETPKKFWNKFSKSCAEKSGGPRKCDEDSLPSTPRKSELEFSPPKNDVSLPTQVGPADTSSLPEVVLPLQSPDASPPGDKHAVKKARSDEAAKPTLFYPSPVK